MYTYEKAMPAVHAEYIRIYLLSQWQVESKGLEKVTLETFKSDVKEQPRKVELLAGAVRERRALRARV